MCPTQSHTATIDFLCHFQSSKLAMELFESQIEVAHICVTFKRMVRPFHSDDQFYNDTLSSLERLQSVRYVLLLLSPATASRFMTTVSEDVVARNMDIVYIAPPAIGQNAAVFSGQARHAVEVVLIFYELVDVTCDRSALF